MRGDEGRSGSQDEVFGPGNLLGRAAEPGQADHLSQAAQSGQHWLPGQPAPYSGRRRVGLRVTLTIAFGLLFPLALGTLFLLALVAVLGTDITTVIYPVRRFIGDSSGLFSLSLLAVAAASGAVGWFFAGLVVRPVEQLAAVVDTVAGSRMNVRIGPIKAPGEIRHLAASVDAMLDRLDEAFAGQDRFIANAAHELKTPLVINRTLVEVAMNRTGAPDEVLRLGENLLEVGVRHDRLINSLLTLARAEEAPALRVPVDLAELAASDAALTVARVEAARRGIKVADHLDPAETYGDPVLLEQIVRNLVDNAVRYNLPEGGWVTIETRQVADRGRASLRVTNTGPVISPHEVPILFEPFRRLTDRVGSAHGSGLGLSIVRAVVRSHGGQVRAEPREGGGLIVTVTL